MIQIRNFRPDDGPAVIAILTGTMRTTWFPHLTNNARATVDIDARVKSYVEAMGQQFILAEHKGKAAGMIHWQDDFLHALHIAPDAQRMGIGAALLAHAENRMQEAGVKTIRLETDSFNKQSRAFYKKHGFVETESYPDTQWDSGFMTLLLIKTL